MISQLIFKRVNEKMQRRRKNTGILNSLLITLGFLFMAGGCRVEKATLFWDLALCELFLSGTDNQALQMNSHFNTPLPFHIEGRWQLPLLRWFDFSPLSGNFITGMIWNGYWYPPPFPRRKSIYCRGEAKTWLWCYDRWMEGTKLLFAVVWPSTFTS